MECVYPAIIPARFLTVLSLFYSVHHLRAYVVHWFLQFALFYFLKLIRVLLTIGFLITTSNEAYLFQSESKFKVSRLSPFYHTTRSLSIVFTKKKKIERPNLKK